MRFSKDANLPLEYTRMEVAGFDWKHAKAAEVAAEKGTKNSLQLSAKEVSQLSKEYHEAPSEGDILPTIQSETPRNETVIVTNSPQKSDAFVPGGVDVTQKWFDNATPNSHEITDVTVFEQDGVVYRVDGQEVKLSYSEHEKAIAELLKQKLGGEIKMMPTVCGSVKNVRTPDYLFRTERYDLKTMSKSTSKRAVFNALHPALTQADNFVLDITNNPLGRSEIVRQIEEEIYQNYNMRSVKVIILVEGDDIVKIFSRK